MYTQDQLDHDIRVATTMAQLDMIRLYLPMVKGEVAEAMLADQDYLEAELKVLEVRKMLMV